MQANEGEEAGKGTAAQERMSGTMRDGTEDKRTETREYSHKRRGSCQHSTCEDLANHRQRSNVATNAGKSVQYGTAEERQRSANVDNPSIAPLDTTRRPSGILQTSGRLRLGLGTLQKKVRFEDEVPGKVTEKLACPSRKFEETKEEMEVTGPQILSGTQHEVLKQPADADVIMVDIDTGLSTLSLLQAHSWT